MLDRVEGNAEDLVQRYSRPLSLRLANNLDSTLFDLLATATELEGHAGLMLDAVNRGAEVPLLDAAGSKSGFYTVLQMLMVALPKEDPHFHLSRCLHRTEVAELVLDRYSNDRPGYDRIMANLGAFEGRPEIERAAVAQSTSRMSEAMAGLITHKTLDDFYVVDAQTLKHSAYISALRGLQDGTTSFDIRFNPAKCCLIDNAKGRSLAEDEWRAAIIAASQIVKEGIRDAIDEAMAAGYIQQTPQIGIIFSFNRSKEYEVMGQENWPVSTMAAFAVNSAGKEIQGLDISGSEYIINDFSGKIAPWAGILGQVHDEMGLITTAHLGDVRNCGGPILKEMIDLAKAFREQGDESAYQSAVLRIFDGFIPFVRGFLEIMPEGSGIGHGYILGSPANMITPFWDDRSRTILWEDLSSYPDSGKTIERLAGLVEMVKDKGFVIEHNPFAAIRNYRDLFPGLQLFDWLKDGIRVRLGTDAGTFSLNGPRVMSDQMAGLLLTRPVSGSPLSIRQLMRLVGYDG